jgi:ABC-type transport system involved in Fe-S cluster assembly fused permease/ATPase subunit
LLLTPPTVVDPVAPEPLRAQASDVRFERVTFAHAGGLPLFTGLDLAVPGGTKLGLVGRSGGGKITLTRLLLRMMDVDEGQILIGGQDISKLRQSDLRSLIAYVPQDPVGFQNSATGPDMGFYAARSYSLMRPPRTSRRLIRSREKSAMGWSGRGSRSWWPRWGRRPW